jgi:hypothetical protein
MVCCTGGCGPSFSIITSFSGRLEVLKGVNNIEELRLERLCLLEVFANRVLGFVPLGEQGINLQEDLEYRVVMDVMKNGAIHVVNAFFCVLGEKLLDLGGDLMALVP